MSVKYNIIYNGLIYRFKNSMDELTSMSPNLSEPNIYIYPSDF